MTGWDGVRAGGMMGAGQGRRDVAFWAEDGGGMVPPPHGVGEKQGDGWREGGPLKMLLRKAGIFEK